MKPILLIVLLMVSRVVFADNLPVFSGQPANQTVSPGSMATFAAAATGATSYQWRFNGADISGATVATLQVANAQTTNSGYYNVIAKNSTGWVPSQLAYLFLDYTYGGTVLGGGGMLPLSNTNNTYFQGNVEPANGPGPANGSVQIVAGPQLDQMQPVGQIVPYRASPVFNRFYNGYYNAPDQSIPTIAPGQAYYYSVVVNYTIFGSPFIQPSTIMRLSAGTNGLTAPSAYGLKFPTWFAGEGLEPVYLGGSPTNQLRVPGETFTLTNWYWFYTDFGVPYGEWRKDGKMIQQATNFVSYAGGSGVGYGGDGVATLTLTNFQANDAGIYDFVLYGNEWIIGPKLFLSVQTTNGPGVFQNPKFVGTNFVCDLAGAAGRNYNIQQSTNLLNWSDLITLSNVTGTITFTNPLANIGAQFYRPVLLP